MIEPVKTEESYFGSRMRTIVCPICGSDYTHEGTPRTIDSRDDYEAWEGRGTKYTRRMVFGTSLKQTILWSMQGLSKPLSIATKMMRTSMRF